jgi:TPR repeat protein
MKKIFIFLLMVSVLKAPPTDEQVAQDISYAILYAYPQGYNDPEVENAFMVHQKGLYQEAYSDFYKIRESSSSEQAKMKATYMMGIMKLVGNGTERSVEESKAFLTEVQEKGSPSEKILATYFLKNLPQWEEKFSLLNDPSQKLLADLNGLIEAEKDKEAKAFFLYLKGVLLFPYLDYSGIYDSFEKSLKLFEELKLESKYAGIIGLMEVTLAEAYYEDGLGLDKNLPEAAKHFEKAAAQEVNIYVQLGALFRLAQLNQLDIPVVFPSNVTVVTLIKSLSTQLTNPLVKNLAVGFLDTILGKGAGTIAKKMVAAFM